MKKFFGDLKFLAIIFVGTFIYGFLGSYLFFDFKNKIDLIFPRLEVKKNIPVTQPAVLPVVIHPSKKTSDRGLYITWYTATDEKKFSQIREAARAAGLNTLVIDVKEELSKPFLELARKHRLSSDLKIQPNHWLYYLTKKLHQEGFIVTARLVVFKDDQLVLVRPDLAVLLKAGGIYRDKRGGRWSDPYAAEARLYNELMAESAAASGVDEVQLDYIRFPAEGAADYIFCPHEKENISKVEIINQFLASVKQRLEKYQVSLAGDIFGVTAWQSENDIKNLGQDLKLMSQYVDVISPMLYPSHFHDGYDGYPNPGAEPYYFIYTGVNKARQILGPGAKTIIIPWIQGFEMKSPNFGPEYILKQIKAARQAGSER